MSATEVLIGLDFIVATLEADTQLSSIAPGGVHRGIAPEGTNTPFVIVGFQAGSDVVTVNGGRVFVEGTFMAKAVGEDIKTRTVAQAADRIDAVLGSPPTSGTTADGSVLSCYRQSPLQYDESVSGEQWTHFGGLHRLQIQKT